MLIFAGCTKQEQPTVDHAAHQMEMPAEESDHGMSIYQVASKWTTQDDDIVELESLSGEVIVAAMTYTSCEVSCPRIVASMKTIQRRVGEKIGFVLFSMDPDRDTPEKMYAYAEKMNLDLGRWTLMTARPDDVLELSALLGVRFRKMADGEFAHSNILSVLSAAGEIIHQQNGLGADLTTKTADFIEAL